MTYTDKAIEALERALSRKEWREDGWEVPAIDVQEALDALKAEQAIMCEACRWEAGFGASPVNIAIHTHPVEEADVTPGSEEALIRHEATTFPGGPTLDPRPWVYTGARLTVDEYSRIPNVGTFEPRDGYSQNPEDYKHNARWDMENPNV